MADAKFAPQPQDLERNHILEDILQHCTDYAGEYKDINYNALKDDVIRPVIENHFDPETQLRGFLKVFQRTLAYNAAFANIQDEDLKKRINAFANGESSKQASDGLKINVSGHASPGVQHHFSLIRELRKLFLSILELKNALTDCFHPRHTYVKDLPIVWEDSVTEAPVEVSH